MWKTSQNREVRDCALSKWQKHYEHKCSHVRSLMYPYSLWHLLLTAMIFILMRSDAIIFLTCFTKNIFKKLCHFQNPEWSLPWSHLKSTKLRSCHLLILMSETVKCHSESARSLHEYGKERQDGSRKWENNLLYGIKKGGGGILTVSTVFWYFISCKKGELKFTKLKSLKIRELFSIKE